VQSSANSSPNGTSKAAAATDQAVGAIMRLLTSGELGPGDRLPPERDLALHLGLSRSTVREAIRGLEMMRVLQVRHGEGVFVTSLNAQLLLEATGFAMQLMRDHEVVELLELRAVLEGAAAAWASARMSDEQLRALLQRLDRMDRATTADQLLEADIAFHACIAEGAGNAVLASVLESFSARTYHARHLRAGLDLDQALESAKLAHHRIYDAVASRDPESARSSASTHVSVVAGWLRSVLNEEYAPPAHSEAARPGRAPRKRRARR
jgi:GntR family transcriptional regulator, transcriptional repressor for pyruvate dehydrogenase complex